MTLITPAEEGRYRKENYKKSTTEEEKLTHLKWRYSLREWFYTSLRPSSPVSETHENVLAAFPVAIGFRKHFIISGYQSFVRTSLYGNTWGHTFHELSHPGLRSGAWAVKRGKQLCSLVVHHNSHVGLSFGNFEST